MTINYPVQPMRSAPHLIRGLNDLCAYVTKHIQSSPPPGQPLAPYHPVLLVEIGCYSGESTITFAAAFPDTKIISIDPWLPNFDTNDPVRQSQTDMSMAEKLFDARTLHFKNVVKFKDTHQKAVKSFGCNTIDLLYLDGAHSYAATKEAILTWLPKVRPNGFVAGHDYYESPQVQVPSACWDTIGNPDATFDDWSFIWQKTKEKMEERGL